MIIIRNNIIPFKGFAAINICGILFVRNSTKVTDIMLNHERIHTKQIIECLVIPFYLIYLINYIVNLCIYKNTNAAYRNIMFEREAYANEHNLNYNNERRWYSWNNYLTSKTYE